MKKQVGAKKRIVILISGRGSNMKSIVEFAQAKQNIEIAAVLANRADSQGLLWAQEHNILTQVVEHVKYPTREAFDVALQEAVSQHSPDLVVLAGFMRILTEQFVGAFEGRLLNIHPSILPLFPGLDTHKKAIDQGCLVHGCSVHFVTAQLDAGPVICQGLVPVYPSDTEDQLSERVLKLEHQIYPAAIDYCLNNSCEFKPETGIIWHQPQKTLFLHSELTN